MADVLVVYYSLHGNVARMARHVARGVEEVKKNVPVGADVPAVVQFAQ